MSLLFPPDSWAVVTILLEAEAEPYAGKVAVAEVIRNRMRAGYFSDGSIAGTCLRPMQFSCWNGDSKRRGWAVGLDSSLDIVLECRRAWRESVERGSESTAGALLYYATWLSKPPRWAARCRQTAEIGQHKFFVPGAVQPPGGG